MLKSLRKYVAESESTEGSLIPIYQLGRASIPPIIWETGNIAQIRSLLVLREAELILAKSQLTGNDYFDWRVKNKVLDLEMNIADLRKWLAEARNDNDGG